MVRVLSNKAGLYLKQLREKATLEKCEAGQRLPGFDSKFGMHYFYFFLSLFFLRQVSPCSLGWPLCPLLSLECGD